jgi:hypothetical protein
VRPVAGLAAALCLAVVLTACGDTHVDEGPGTKPASSSTSDSHPAPAAGARSKDGVWTALSTGCGVLSATVDGTLWIADPPLGNDGPPPGWGAEETWGHFVPGARGRAMFRGEDGQIALFRRAGPEEADPAADCD